MKRFFRTFSVILLLGIFLIGGGILFLLSPSGQRFVTKRVTAYLHGKLNTRVEVQKISYHIPDWISLEGVYLEDLKHDTLLAGGKIFVDIDMRSLLHNKVALNEIILENIHLKVNREDSIFNYDYILKAFTSTSSTNSNSSPLDISLKSIKAKNISINYHDKFAGSDADIFFQNMETNFDKFNPTKSQYHLKNTILLGGNAYIKLYETNNKVIENVTTSSDSLDLKLGKFQAKNLAWKVDLEESGIKNTGKLSKFITEIDKIYLTSQQISLKETILENGNFAVNFAKKPISVKQNTAENLPASTTKGWIFNANKLMATNTSVSFDDENFPTQKTGLDYKHLQTKNINFDLEKLVYKTNFLAGNLQKLTFKEERSGLNLQDFHTEFSSTSTKTSLKNFYLKTPNSVLQNDFSLQYTSLEQFSNNLENVHLETKILKSQVAFKDILLLAPTLAKEPIFKKNRNETLKFEGILAGKINNLGFQKVTIHGFGETRLNADGRILGLPNTEKLAFDIKLNEFFATKKDLLKTLPDSLIPKNIELPNQFTLFGTAKGKISDLTLDATFISDVGNATFAGKLVNISADKNQQYDGIISLQNFYVGKLTKQSENIGKVTLTTTIKGTGFDPNTATASINGTMQEAFIKGYTYKNLSLAGNIANKIATIEGKLNDENATLKLISTINFADKFPTISAKTSIEKLNFQPLKLYADNISLTGIFDINFTSTNPENPIGEIRIKEGILVNNGTPIAIKNTFLSAQNFTDEKGAISKMAVIESPFLKGVIKGNFEYQQLPDILLTETNKYFATPTIAYQKIIKPYTFSLQATVVNDPIFQAFFPSLKRLDSTKIFAYLDSQREDTTMRINAFIPVINYDSSQVNNMNFSAFATSQKVHYESSFQKITNENFQVGETILRGNIANNLIDFRVSLKDSIQKSQYAFGGFVESKGNNFQLKFRKNLLLNYEKWSVDSTSFMQFGKDGILVKNFVLIQKNQQLRIKSLSEQPNSPIKIEADSLKLATFLKFIQQDSLMASGQLDGNIILKNYMTEPIFTGDFVINNFVFTQIPIGNLQVKAYNETANKIVTETSLVNEKNDILLTGSYDLKNKNPFDLTIAIKKLGAETIQAFSFGQLRKTTGNLEGNITLKGSIDSPILNGEIDFNNVVFNPTKLGASYKIDKQKISFKGQEINLTKFAVTDSTGQSLVVDGKIGLTQLPNLPYDLTVNTTNFMVLNATQKDNDFFYGKGFVDAKIHIKGKGITAAAIDGDIKVQNPSNITVIMPDDATQKEEIDGIVKFVNKGGEKLTTAIKIDSSAINTDYLGSEISLNIDADDKSALTIVIDPLNGDNIKVKGNANLNAGITSSGQLFVFGSYTITEGTYDMTYQLLRKSFQIDKGSYLSWSGDPMKADMKITAIYKIDASPKDLFAGTDYAQVADLINYRNNIPLQVQMEMSNNLQKPVIDFYIKPDNLAITDDQVKSATGTILDELNKAENANKRTQKAFAILVLNKYLPDDKTTSDVSFLTNLNAESIARQSVSKLLSDQLSKLASQVKGVNIDLNLNSSSTTNDAGTLNQTNLNVGLSKAFLNNRLTFSVGRNFELEDKTTSRTRNANEIFDNASVNYNLTEDGRYLFRAYRKNDFQTVLDGFVITTGVSFRATMDYQKFTELFRK